MKQPTHKHRERDFLRACQSLVDKECEADAQLRGKLHKPWTLKRIAKAIWHYTLFAVVSVFLLGVLAAPAVVCRGIPLDQMGVCLCGMLFTTCWCIAFIGIRRILSIGAFSVPSVFFFVPIQPSEVHALARRKLMAFPWLFFLSLFLLLGSLAFRCDALYWINVLFIFGLTMLCTLASWTVALWFTHEKIPPQIINYLPLIGFILSGVVLAITSKNMDGIHPLFHSFITHYGEPLAMLTPGGWAIGIFAAKMDILSQNWGYALLPLFGLALSMPFAFRSLERRFNFEKCWIDYSPLPEDECSGAAVLRPRGIVSQTCEGAAQQRRYNDTVDMDDIRRHWAPVCEIPRVGWLERLFVRRLSAQEKTTLEHLSLSFPRWTLWTLRCAGLWIVLAILVTLGIMEYDSNIVVQVITTVTGVFLCFTTLLFIATTLPPFTMFEKAPHKTVYPFSLKQFLGVNQKATNTRCFAIAPVYLAIGLFAGYHGSFITILVIINLLFFVTLGFPYIAPLRLLALSPLPSLKTLLTLFIGFCFFVLICVFLSLSFVLLAKSPALSFVCILLCIIVCRCWKATFLRLYDRGYYG